jgi:hypothetical protein
MTAMAELTGQNMPTAQGEGAVAPAGQKVPAGQDVMEPPPVQK